MSVHQFSARLLNGEEASLSRWQGRVLLIVNTASECGLTPQYEDLQGLYTKYSEQGLVVLGFPCNQFGGQEPGSDADVKTFCSTTYGVSFPMFSKIEVNGAGRTPLYAWLTAEKTKPDGPGDIVWNFAKFVVGKYGQVKARFNPRVAPSDPALRGAIESALAE